MGEHVVGGQNVAGLDIGNEHGGGVAGVFHVELQTLRHDACQRYA
jgi:hypothetical protein